MIITIIKRIINIVLILCMFYLVYSIVDYFLPIKYELHYDRIYIENGAYGTEYSAKLTISSTNGFLPNSNVNADVVIIPRNQRGVDILRKSPLIVFENSTNLLLNTTQKERDDSLQLVYGAYYHVVDDLTNDTSVKSEIISIRNSARIVLTEEIDENENIIFKGETDVLYKTTGSYNVVLYSPQQKIPTKMFKIEIGSTSDYLNINTNQILSVLALLAILIAARTINNS